MIRPFQLYERVINKNAKGITELQNILSKLAQQMLKQYQPEQQIELAWQQYDNIVDYFLHKGRSYLSYQSHRVLVIQSLQSIGFSLAQSRQINKYFKQVTGTILSFFSDSSQKVKVTAIGAIYNLLTKYIEQGRDFFIDIFERLSVLITDESGQIRQAATFLNKALKIVVYDAEFDQTGLNLKGFVQILSERLQTGGTLAKEFMLDWLMAIEQVPQFEISFDMPLFFRQVFLLLEDPCKSLKSKAEQCLKKFLYVFRQRLAIQGKISSKLSKDSAHVIFEMILLLVRQNIHSQINFHALEWLEVFTKFFTLQLTKKSQKTLQPLYSSFFKQILLVVITTLSDQADRIRKISSRINEALLNAFPQMNVSKKSVIKTSQLLEGLLSESRAILRVQAILRWIKIFLQNYTQYYFSSINHLIELIIQKLCDKNATKTLFQLIEGSLFVEKYFDQLVSTLLNYLHRNDKISPEPIFKQMLALKGAENHFILLCQSVKAHPSQIFQYRLIQCLICVLVSEHSLQGLRSDLISKQKSQLFTKLFFNFQTNEAASLILCFLSGKYYLAKKFIEILALEERLSDKNFRTLVRMSNLIEHSNMNHLRSDLRKSSIAIKAYLSLLMALPYGKCSGLLLQRLPPQIPQLSHYTVDNEEEELTNFLLNEYEKSYEKSRVND